MYKKRAELKNVFDNGIIIESDLNLDSVEFVSLSIAGRCLYCIELYGNKR